MKIAIVGSGYVGLVTGACLADVGHDVVCIDKNQSKINALSNGVVPIFEPGLAELIATNLATGRLSFTTDFAPAIAEAEVVFIAVGTPSRRGDGHADLTFVHAAAKEVAEFLDGFTVVVTKSTVPVGTGDAVARIVGEANPTADVVVVSNPEFLRQGAALENFKRPDRIVIGVEDDRARQIMNEVYRPLDLDQARLQFTDRRTAELIKYASNAFLAMKITFINEIADLCEASGADVQDVAHGMGLDSRIGPEFLHAGPGFGGSCFPKDTRALLRIGQDFGSALRLVETTVLTNEQRKRAMASKVIVACGGDVQGKRIGVLGLTFKPDTDDMREAPSLDIIHDLRAAGACIQAYDPKGMDAAREIFHDIALADDAYDAAAGADAVVLITEWKEFRSLDLMRLRSIMKTPVFVDLRNVYRPDEMTRAGFCYVSIGRSTPTADKAGGREM